ncbi:hypothetical protein F5J12DRAFT_785850 [Pisolithus orientalis]|uniref:uncharacterized protein n=1 Tax=Pisolithus orientalis TaxID=936130 RepID=UPI0022252F87|nr:uncharacterized protein F5J12DRAFT_785850 [Pisolithus orientalis]KAI5994066.1 hypothetical protein F5J12DRAFT_785850 [Pisolithus orientalis]
MTSASRNSRTTSRKKHGRRTKDKLATIFHGFAYSLPDPFHYIQLIASLRGWGSSDTRTTCMQVKIFVSTVNKSWILGEIGVGKSSVINLISRGKTSPRSLPTPRFARATTVESMKVHIWEVSGFNQPKNDPMKDATDIEQKLGPMLKAHARIDVILFCMRGKKLTVVTKRIFELVDGIFGGRIPIVLVINHLEQEEEMEDWWRRNKGQTWNEYE